MRRAVDVGTFLFLSVGNITFIFFTMAANPGEGGAQLIVVVFGWAMVNLIVIKLYEALGRPPKRLPGSSEGDRP